MHSVDVVNLWFRYPGSDEYALRGINSSFSGRVLCLLGYIGAGKSTLLYAMAGLIKPEKGEVRIDGRNVLELPRRLFGMAFQNPDDQFVTVRVFDELAFTVSQLKEEYEEDVLRVAERFGIAGLLDKNVMKLSYGQKKLVSIASILVHDPEFVLLDEPTSNIPPSLKRLIFGVVRELRERGKLVVIATHDIELAAKLCEEAWLLRDGKIVEKVSGADVSEDLLDSVWGSGNHL